MADEKITHALEDILHDSYIWDETANVLGDCATKASQLQLSAKELSIFSKKSELNEEEVNLKDLYEQLRATLARLLHEGSVAQEEIADRLLATAQHYEETEQDALDRLGEVAQLVDNGEFDENRLKERQNDA